MLKNPFLILSNYFDYRRKILWSLTQLVDYTIFVIFVQQIKLVKFVIIRVEQRRDLTNFNEQKI